MLALHAEAGIADHQADVERAGRLEHFPRRSRFGQVNLANMRLNAVLSRELRGQFLEALYAAGNQYEVQFLFGEKLREGLTDAGGRTRDEGDGPVSVEKIGHVRAPRS